MSQTNSSATMEASPPVPRKNKKNKQAKTKTKRVGHAYSAFVKTHYADAKKQFKRPQDRIRHIASLWRAQKAKAREAAPAAAN